MVLSKEQQKLLMDLSIEITQVGNKYNLNLGNLVWEDFIMLVYDLKKLDKKYDKILKLSKNKNEMQNL